MGIEGRIRAGIYNFVHRNGNEYRQMGTSLFEHHRILSLFNIVECDRIYASYTFLRGRWCKVIIQNMCVPSQEKSDDTRDSFMRKCSVIFLSCS